MKLSLAETSPLHCVVHGCSPLMAVLAPLLLFAPPPALGGTARQPLWAGRVAASTRGRFPARSRCMRGARVFGLGGCLCGN